MTRLSLALALAAAPAFALAHEGHGLPGSSHWHVTDAWGFVAAAAVVAAVIWFSRKK